MSMENEKWTAYFSELDPEKRMLIFNDTVKETDAEAAFIANLYTERYRDAKDPDRKVDNWLWKFVYLPGLYKKRRISKSAFRNETERTLRELHLDGTASENEKQLLYLEYRNAARRYLGTCGSRRYGSRLFGLREASPEEKKEKACEELWMISRGIALASGKETAMAPFIEALRAELSVFYPGYDAVYERLEKTFKK